MPKSKQPKTGTRAAKPSRKPKNPPTDEDIRRRAYELFEDRGGEPGHEVEDWLEAKRQLGDEP